MSDEEERDLARRLRARADAIVVPSVPLRRRRQPASRALAFAAITAVLVLGVLAGGALNARRLTAVTPVTAGSPAPSVGTTTEPPCPPPLVGTLIVCPAVAPIGSVVRISGLGCHTPGGPAIIYFGSAPQVGTSVTPAGSAELGRFPVDADGRFEVTVTLPTVLLPIQGQGGGAVTPGSYAIYSKPAELCRTALTVTPDQSRASPTLPPTVPGPVLPSGTVRIQNALPASGEWALILRRTFDQSPNQPNQASGPARPPTTDSIIAVPLSARVTTQRDTLNLLSFTSQVTEGARPRTDNLLRAQFSPDGHRLVLSVTVGAAADARLGLVVIDLIAGTASALTTDAAYDDDTPAWSPTGDDIAFVRTRIASGSFRDAGIWVIRADGGGLRQVLGGADAIRGTSVYSWNGDATGIGYADGLGSYNVLDLTTGQHARLGAFTVQTGRGMADWRTGRPAFVGAFADSPNGGRRSLVTADDERGGGARTVRSGTELNTYFAAARWRPGSNDVLYVELFQDPNVQLVGGSPAAPKNTRTVYATDESGRTPRAVVSKVYSSLFAEWTHDGRDIVYVDGLGVAGSVHLIAPDGTNDRVVSAYGGAPESKMDWLDLAVLAVYR